jgi:hypothetical protein
VKVGRTSKRFMVVVAVAGLASTAIAGVARAGDQLAEPEQLSKKEYLKQANGICRDGNEQLEVAFEEFFADFREDQQPTPEQLEELVGIVVPIFRTALGAVEELEGPPALDKKVDSLVADYEEVLEEIEADPEVAFGEDAPDPFKALDKRAKKLGLKSCAQGSD